MIQSRSLGPLSRDAKRKIRDDEEDYRARGDMYFDDMWCMWRCRSRGILYSPLPPPLYSLFVTFCPPLSPLSSTLSSFL